MVKWRPEKLNNSPTLTASQAQPGDGLLSAHRQPCVLLVFGVTSSKSLVFPGAQNFPLQYSPLQVQPW